MRALEALGESMVQAWRMGVHRRAYGRLVGGGWERHKPHILWTLYQVWRVWRLMPEQRLGQLIDNALGFHDGGILDLFVRRDEELVRALQEFAAEQRR